MYGKKVKLRILFLVLILLSVILSIFLILQSLKENVIYFQSPSEIKSLVELDKKKIRVGGMVKEQSINITSKEVKFIITDFKNEINVTYSGAVPNLFAEGKGVVAEGKLNDKFFFVADRILAKHDENYMPPEIKKIIEKNAK
jgi:cytochrome c-type biogenesis protein CcmE